MELAPICRREYTPEGAAIYRDRGAGPKVRIRLPPAASQQRTVRLSAISVRRTRWMGPLWIVELDGRIVLRLSHGRCTLGTVCCR
jgi:hypothetical protein